MATRSAQKSRQSQRPRAGDTGFLSPIRPAGSQKKLQDLGDPQTHQTVTNQGWERGQPTQTLQGGLLAGGPAAQEQVSAAGGPPGQRQFGSPYQHFTRVFSGGFVLEPIPRHRPPHSQPIRKRVQTTPAVVDRGVIGIERPNPAVGPDPDPDSTCPFLKRAERGSPLAGFPGPNP